MQESAGTTGRDVSIDGSEIPTKKGKKSKNRRKAADIDTTLEAVVATRSGTAVLPEEHPRRDNDSLGSAPPLADDFELPSKKGKKAKGRQELLDRALGPARDAQNEKVDGPRHGKVEPSEPGPVVATQVPVLEDFDLPAKKGKKAKNRRKATGLDDFQETAEEFKNIENTSVLEPEEIKASNDAVFTAEEAVFDDSQPLGKKGKKAKKRGKDAGLKTAYETGAHLSRNEGEPVLVGEAVSAQNDQRASTGGHNLEPLGENDREEEEERGDPDHEGITQKRKIVDDNVPKPKTADDRVKVGLAVGEDAAKEFETPAKRDNKSKDRRKGASVAEAANSAADRVPETSRDNADNVTDFAIAKPTRKEKKKKGQKFARDPTRITENETPEPIGSGHFGQLNFFASLQ
ncbi:MAG: hypothetical protein M1826_000486 [Phylliscum demangeonii]|nr:MAG: hypothetical protein M1826_000486 [Phylliscum demangeonii]